MHPLWQPPVVAAIEAAASAHLGRRWVAQRFTDLHDKASHPAGILHGDGFSVFAKFDLDVWKSEQFTTELRGLNLVRDRSPVATPQPVGAGVIDVEPGSLLLLEAIAEIPVENRRPEFRRNGGTRSSTLAVQMTLVLPASTSTEPSA